MQATVIVTASKKAGNLSRLMLAIKKLGYKLESHHYTSQKDIGIDKIVLNIESKYPVTEESLQILQMVVPNVVNVQVIGASVDEPEQAADTTTPVEEIVVTLNNITGREIDGEAERLTAAYPNIYDGLVALKHNYGGADGADVTQLMQTVGRKLGAHAAAYSQEHTDSATGILNSTVKNSLSMSKSQFGGMPVIADLMAKGTPKPKSAKPNLLQLAETELSRFVSVKRSNNAYSILNCPHCNSKSSAVQSDCHFMLSFLNSFFAASPGSIELVVKQAGSCRFEVFRA